MDPLLRRSLGDTARGGADPCPDADTLAAFVDAALSDAERRAVETHVADCGRCSAIVVMTADTSHAAPQPAAVPHLRAHDAARNPWRHAYWTVPLATAATVAGLWIAIPREAVAPAPTTIASARPDESQPPEIFRDAPDAVAPQRDAPAAASPAPQPPAPRVSEDQARAAAVGAAEGAANSERLMARQAETSIASQAPPPAAAPTAPPPPAMAPQADVAETVELRRELAGVAADAAAAAVRFGTPDGRVQWRVARTRIERSADGGMTWTPEYTAARAVTTGVAVDAEAAWAGGEQGLVLRRTAGGWAAVTTPLPQRIIAIRATSATAASVTTAEGLTLQTTDAGASWR